MYGSIQPLQLNPYLVDAIDELGDGNWSGDGSLWNPSICTIDSTLFPTTPDLVAYFEQEGLQPIGSLFLPDDNDTGPTDPTDRPHRWWNGRLQR